MIQLALFDPCGGSQPVAEIGQPVEDTDENRLRFAVAIDLYNQLPETSLVLAVTERAYVRPRVDASRCKSTKMMGEVESRKSNAG